MDRVIIPVPFAAEAVSIANGDHVFAKYIDSIYCGGAGNLVVRFRSGSTSFTYAVSAGQVLFGDFERVVASGTTATLLIG